MTPFPPHYDELGRIEKLTRDNGVVTDYAFDMAGQLTAIGHTKGREVLAVSHYALDVLGRRTTQTREDNITERYGYDATGPLTAVDYGTVGTASRGDAFPHSETFAYDPAGNRTAASLSTLTSQLSTSYSANALNQYTLVAGVALSYDTNGNLVDDGKQRYRYDSQNRLIGVESATVKAEFFYDARSRCVLRKYYSKGSQGKWALDQNGSRALTYDASWNLLAGRKLSGAPVETYVHGQRIDEILKSEIDGQAIYPVVDGLGSTVALANAEGKVVERFRYSVYGQPSSLEAGYQAKTSSATGYKMLYTGREWLAQVGLNDHRHRYCSPGIGRWTATYPIGFGGGLNVYSYVGNQPTNSLDAFGLEACCANNAAKETDNFGRSCCAEAMTSVQYQVQLEGERHGVLKIGADTYIGFGPRDINSLGWGTGTTDGYGHPLTGRTNVTNMKACPDSVSAIQSSATQHANDTYSYTGICGSNCREWAVDRLYDAGFNLSSLGL